LSYSLLVGQAPRAGKEQNNVSRLTRQDHFARFIHAKEGPAAQAEPSTLEPVRLNDA
jgi:hypothetical protein